MRIEIHHYIHSNTEHDSDVIKLLRKILNINENIMAKQEQFESVLSRIDTATNKIAEQLRALKDQISNQGLPGDVEDQVLARLETAATQLEAVGASPENPVPEVPETPVA